MRHLRSDYDVVQDVSALSLGDLRRLEEKRPTSIGVDEPVFLLRGKDPSAATAVRAWANDVEDRGGDKLLVARVRAWAAEMAAWHAHHAADRVVADAPDGVLR